MIRFIFIGDQITEGEKTEFALYNTVTNKFITDLGGFQTWESIEDFVNSNTRETVIRCGGIVSGGLAINNRFISKEYLIEQIEKEIQSRKTMIKAGTDLMIMGHSQISLIREGIKTLEDILYIINKQPEL